MAPAVEPPPPAAPPDDPVRAALEDAGVRGRLLAQARAVLRGRPPEDAVQEVCQRVWGLRHRYDPTRGTVGGWLFGIADNVFREVARAEARRPPTADVEAVPAPPDLWVDLADVRSRVEWYLTRLPADEQAAVRLRYLDELDYPEMAARLGVTVLNARMRVSRGLRRLQQWHGGEGRP